MTILATGETVYANADEPECVIERGVDQLGDFARSTSHLGHNKSLKPMSTTFVWRKAKTEERKR
jgi:hypothetical protein